MSESPAEQIAKQLYRELFDTDLLDKYGITRGIERRKSIILSAITKATEAQTTILGFASWKDGHFELIVCDKESCEETTLKGQLEPGQFEQINKILPTCVMVKVDSRAAPDSAEQQDFACKILAIRDAIIASDIDEAFHQLYSIADPTFKSFTPWAEFERIAAQPQKERTGEK